MKIKSVLVCCFCLATFPLLAQGEEPVIKNDFLTVTWDEIKKEATLSDTVGPFAGIALPDTAEWGLLQGDAGRSLVLHDPEHTSKYVLTICTGKNDPASAFVALHRTFDSTFPDEVKQLEFPVIVLKDSPTWKVFRTGPLPDGWRTAGDADTKGGLVFGWQSGNRIPNKIDVVHADEANNKGIFTRILPELLPGKNMLDEEEGYESPALLIGRFTDLDEGAKKAAKLLENTNGSQTDGHQKSE